MPTKSKSKKSTTSSKAKKQVALPKKQPIVNPNNNKLMVRRQMHNVCGLSDPFCDHANGAKYPDSSNVRTLTLSLKGTFDVITNASGVAAFLFQPDFMYLPQSTPTVLGVGGLVTGWDARSAMNTNLPATGYRIVSAGFHMRRICAPLTTSGIVRIRSWGTNNFGTLDTIPTATYNATSISDVSLQDLKDFAAICPHSAASPQLIYNTGVDTPIVSNSTPNGYQPITVFVGGAPASTTVIVVSWVINYELVFDEDQALAQLATPSPPANSIITTAAAKVTSTLPSFFDKGVSMVAGYIERKALSALGSFLGGPAGAAVGTGMAMLVD